MQSWTPSDIFHTYAQCSIEIGHCYCEYKGTGPCRPKVPAAEVQWGVLAQRLRDERGRDQLALGLALAGLLLWPLGIVAMILARPRPGRPTRRAYPIGIAESVWCAYIVAVIVAHHL